MAQRRDLRTKEPYVQHPILFLETQVHYSDCSCYTYCTPWTPSPAASSAKSNALWQPQRRCVRAQEAVDLVLRYPQSQAFLAAEELVNEAKRRWIQQVRRRQASILRFFGTVRVWERAKQCFVRSKKQVKPLEPPPKCLAGGSNRHDRCSFEGKGPTRTTVCFRRYPPRESQTSYFQQV